MSKCHTVEEVSRTTILRRRGEIGGRVHQDGAEPFSLTVAITLMPAVKAELERMEKMGVITSVQAHSKQINWSGQKWAGQIAMTYKLNT